MIFYSFIDNKANFKILFTINFALKKFIKSKLYLQFLSTKN